MTFRLGPIILHSIAAALLVYAYNSLDSLAASAWVNSQKGGHFQFLTIQGLCIALLTMFTSLLIDILPSSSVLLTIKRTLLMISMSLATVISPIYWSLLLFFPSLILQTLPSGNTEPSSFSPEPIRLPLGVDLAMHAAPALTLFADFFLFQRKYDKREIRYAPYITTAYGIFYASWVEYCASHNKRFPYPFLTENPLHIRLGIYVAASSFSLFAFWGLNALHPRKV